MTQEEMLEILKLNEDKIERMIEIGLLFDKETAEVRQGNKGKSNYATLLIQPWSIMHEHPEWSYLEGDLLKRLMRTKNEPGLTKNESRMLDFEKMEHIIKELKRIHKYKIIHEKE